MKDNDYRTFLERLRQSRGIDLQGYNQAQMQRRVTLLARKYGYTDFASLARAMGRDDELFQEFINRLTINVTGFFRDTVHWQTLAEKVRPLLAASSQFQVWSAGCSTGEEVYSLVFMLARMAPLAKFTVLGTDLDSNALATARDGVYPAPALRGLAPEKIKAMFVPLRAGYQVRLRYRSRAQFRRHNLLADPFPAHTDLIVCRNVMIYFQDKTKKELYSRFAQALKPGGLLFVGAAEQIISPGDYGLINEDVYFYRKATE